MIDKIIQLNLSDEFIKYATFLSIVIVVLTIGLPICIISERIRRRNKKIRVYSRESIDSICQNAAFFRVTKGMKPEEIYTKSETIRTPVAHRIHTQYLSLAAVIYPAMDDFVQHMQKLNIVDDDEQILVKNLPAAGQTLLDFLKTSGIWSERPGSNSMTPEAFFALKRQQTQDISGVYILYNRTKNMPYVGQATRLFFRINQHLTGHGNGDVYADYKYGDEFDINYVPLQNSGFDSLDALEKAKIAEYNAYEQGYNKTQGNG